MMLRFTKMHGLGNDFVVIDAVSQAVAMTPELARKLADRQRGIGCDQILLVEPPANLNVDFRYRIFNRDGSEVAQCGNGARCFAKFVHDQKLTGKKQLRVETTAGLIELHYDNPKKIRAAVGIPEFTPSNIPFDADETALTYPLQVADETLEIAALAIGNPHAVLRVEDVDTAPVAELGPLIESHRRFPEKTNVGFMQVISRHEIRLRVYERGAGETLACGSGACAAVVAGIRQDLLDSPVTATLKGGTLEISWPGGSEPVTLTGSATTVFQGRIRI